MLSAQKVLLAGFCIAVAEATGKLLHVEKVENPTHAEEYQCISDGDGDDPATNYTWYRHDWKALPEGVKAEGNRLHFLILTSELNGLYFCQAEHNQGVTRASLYKYTKKDSFLNWMLPKGLVWNGYTC
ncbi:hypothetical protein MHYP_G00064190 [Metynnis hypsauchen]